jgi:hypothetical protein
VVDASRFIQAFGDIATPYEVTVKETLAWYQAFLKSHERPSRQAAQQETSPAG